MRKMRQLATARDQPVMWWKVLLQLHAHLKQRKLHKVTYRFDIDDKNLKRTKFILQFKNMVSMFKISLAYSSIGSSYDCSLFETKPSSLETETHYIKSFKLGSKVNNLKNNNFYSISEIFESYLTTYQMQNIPCLSPTSGRKY